MFKRLLLLTLIFLMIVPAIYAQEEVPPPPGIYDALSDVSVRIGKTFTIRCSDPNDGSTCEASDLSLDWDWSFEVYPDTAIGCPQAFPNPQPTSTRAYRYTFTYNNIVYDYRQNADRTGLFLCTQTGAEMVTPSAPVAPAEQCPMIPRLAVNTQARVVDNGVPNNMRSGAGRNNDKIGEIPAGALFTVLEGPLCTVDFIWWRVDYNGLVGWTVEGGTDNEYFLEPLVAPAQAVQPLTTANIGQLRQLAAQNIPATPLDMDYSPLLDRMAYTQDGVRIQEPFTNAAPISLGTAGQTYEQVAFNPASTILAAAEYNFNTDKAQIRLWNVSFGATPPFTERSVLPLTGRLSSELLFSPDGKRLAVSNSNGTDNLVQIYDVPTGTSLASLAHDSFPAAIRFNADGTLLAVVTDNSEVVLWDMTTFTETATLSQANTEGITGGVHNLAANANQIAVSGNDNVIEVWDLTTRSLARSFTLPEAQSIYEMAYSSDGSVLVVAAGVEMLNEGNVYFLDANTGAVLRNEPLFAFVFDFASDNTLHIMSMKSDGTGSWSAWGVPQ